MRDIILKMWDERESGYNKDVAQIVPEKIEELKSTLPDRNEIRYIQKIDKILFCHGE